MRLLSIRALAVQAPELERLCAKCANRAGYLAAYRDSGGVACRLMCAGHADALAEHCAAQTPAVTRTCRHCARHIVLFGGIWFEWRHSAVCHRSPDTQHRPYSTEVPPRSAPRPVVARVPSAYQAVRDSLSRLRVLAHEPQSTLTDHVRPLPASVIARCADTTSTHGAAHRRGWN